MRDKIELSDELCTLIYQALYKIYMVNEIKKSLRMGCGKRRHEKGGTGKQQRYGKRRK